MKGLVSSQLAGNADSGSTWERKTLDSAGVCVCVLRVGGMEETTWLKFNMTIPPTCAYSKCGGAVTQQAGFERLWHRLPEVVDSDVTWS